MTRIKELPLSERPREKALTYGAESLSNSELLAIIIGTGVKNHSALEIGNKLLEEYKGLIGLSKTTRQQLMLIDGLSKHRALVLESVFELINRYAKSDHDLGEKVTTSEQVFRKYQKQFSSSMQELVLVVMLNQKNYPIKEEIIYKGAANEVTISIREILTLVLKNSAMKFILVHNHPSGDLNPSRDDILATKSIIKAAKSIGVLLLDHIIIANNKYYSFVANCEM